MKNLNKLLNMDSVYLRRLYKTSCMAFRVGNRFEKKGGVVFVGDSITDFCNLDAYYPELDAVNRGISGDTIEGIRGRLEESIFGLSPSLVVLLGGANNFAEGYEDVETHIIETYRDILSQIKARLPKTKVLVQSIYPVSDVSFHNRYKFGHGHIVSINQKLKVLVQSFGYKFADVYSVLNSGDEEFNKKYTDDGLHPNAHGYKVISGYLSPIIDAMLKEEETEDEVAVMSSIKEKEEMTTFVEKMLISILALTMGILFCCGVSAAVSITLGVILCVYGVINIAVIGVSRRPLFSVMGVVDAVIIAIGVAFCTHDLSTMIVLLIPFIMEILGALMFIDAFVYFLVFRHGGVIRMTVFAVAGALLCSLGLSFLIVEDLRIGYAQLVTGILLCIAATVLFTTSIVGRVKQKNKEKRIQEQE
ncbi:MAG: hypothetical protein IK048_00270 [Clostridia bacterium]|nr:hypothetical protein [Clostridia bacterium]